MTRRVLSIVLAAYLALVLQAAALSQWGVGACAPALVLVVVTGIGLNDGWPAAGITALVCGLLLDRFLGNGTFSYTVPLLAAGLASGSRRFALGNEALPPLVLPAAGYVLARRYELAALYLTRGSVYTGGTFWLRLGGGLLLTVAVAWPVFILLQRTLGRSVRMLAQRREGEGLTSAYFFLRKDHRG